MADPFTAALVQTTSGREPDETTAAVLDMVGGAAGRADFVMLPETVHMMEPRSRLLREKAKPEDETPAVGQFREAASKHGIWLLVGSMVIAHGDDTFANRSLLIDSSGDIVARYDKIHMFDVELESGERFRESRNYRPGDKAVVADTPWGRLGMTVCYDVRFPQLYRTLAHRGAEFLSVPSAFTRPTGAAHWEVLLRARAIENECFVFAPAQCGDHEGGRKTYGHSLAVDPWGAVLADGGEDVGITYVEVDPARIGQVRSQLPSLEHDRPFE